MLSDIRAEGLAEAEASLRDAGAEVTGVVADVSDAAAVRAIASRTLEAYGRARVDALLSDIAAG